MTADLRRLAEQATPGPWRTFYDNYEDGTMLVGTVAEGADNIIGDDIKPDNAEYIAAANPAAILALLDERDAAQERYIHEGQRANRLDERRDAAERRVAALEADVLATLDEAFGEDAPDWALALAERIRAEGPAALPTAAERYAAGPQHWQDYRRRLGPEVSDPAALPTWDWPPSPNPYPPEPPAERLKLQHRSAFPPFVSEPRVAALEAGLRGFVALEKRVTGRGSLPLRADLFEAATIQARALLTSGEPEGPAALPARMKGESWQQWFERTDPPVSEASDE